MATNQSRYTVCAQIMLKILTIQYQTKEENKLEFRESDLSPGLTEVKKCKFVKFISRANIIFKRNL